MREYLGSILHPSTLEPLFGSYFGPVHIDNSKEYNSGLFSRLRSVDSVLVDILSENVFLELRIFRTQFRAGASLLLWDRKTGNLQDLQIHERGNSSFLKQGSFKDGYWSFTKSDKRFNFRLDETIRQGYTHSAIWEKDLNFQLDALVHTGDKMKNQWFTKIHPSGKDWLFLHHSPILNAEGQLAWNDVSFPLQDDILAYTVNKGFGTDAFPLENRIYLQFANKKRIHLYPEEKTVLWQSGEAQSLDSLSIQKQGKTRLLSDPSSKLELVLEPELEASFTRPKTFGTERFIKTLYSVSGWVKLKNKKEKVKSGFAILEDLE
ncbi:DUF2804 domain-containing protein [Leptospira langatensis]|uniref:DUF2804 domain-containing protein n=1 Tax=Leptospira langatensis TaxID=2484983 RepID=A0A5F1ZTI1_9LEPT|nr:DUF2804 domain-containing protein [Leptospira langatensis]TGK02650.1 DUF2804 domain-containing protein [Leptospira langatensis]TGL40148.1 DUF2804 domain-containing protein [Leptospira langatensis]